MKLITINLKPGVVYSCGGKEFTNIGGKLYERSNGIWEWSALMVNSFEAIKEDCFEEGGVEE